MTAVVAIACGVVGLAVGSFVCAVIRRAPERLPLLSVSCRCPACSTLIRFRDNPPVLGWVLWRGRCRTCGACVSPRKFAIELLTAGLFVGAGLRFPGSLELLAYCLGFAGLVALSFIDLDTHLLPKRVVWPVAGLVLTVFCLTAVLEGRFDDLVRALLGAVVSAFTLGAIWFLYPQGMGFGDARLEVLLGLLLGWVSRATVLAGFMLAILLGGLVSGAILIATGFRSRKDSIAFGPLLCLGCVLALFWPASGHWLEESQIKPAIEAIRALF